MNLVLIALGGALGAVSRFLLGNAVSKAIGSALPYGTFVVPVFWLAIVLMVCAGASELTMAQWASAYAESAIGLSKTAGDLSGPCLFAAAMGISRVLYGKYGDRMELTGFLRG